MPSLGDTVPTGAFPVPPSALPAQLGCHLLNGAIVPASKIKQTQEAFPPKENQFPLVTSSPLLENPPSLSGPPKLSFVPLPG